MISQICISKKKFERTHGQMDGRTDGQKDARTSPKQYMPLQLFQSWGHQNTSVTVFILQTNAEMPTNAGI